MHGCVRARRFFLSYLIEACAHVNMQQIMEVRSVLALANVRLGKPLACVCLTFDALLNLLFIANC